MNVNFQGVVNLVTAAYPHLRAGRVDHRHRLGRRDAQGATDISQQGPGGAGYSLSKREVARFVHDLALALAPESIRVNAVHPGNVNTDMLHNAPMYKVFRPDLEDATREDFEPAVGGDVPAADLLGGAAGHQRGGAVLRVRRCPLHHRPAAAGRRRRAHCRHTPALPNP